MRKEVLGAIKITKGTALPIAWTTLLKIMPVGAVTRQRRRQRWLIRKKQIPHERLENSMKAFLSRRPGDGCFCIRRLIITRTPLHIACGTRQPRDVIVHLRLMGQDHQRKDVAGLPEVGLGYDRGRKVPLVCSLLAIDPVDSFWIMADDITKMPGCPVFTGDVPTPPTLRKWASVVRRIRWCPSHKPAFGAADNGPHKKSGNATGGGILMAVRTPRSILHQHRRHLSRIGCRLLGVTQGVKPHALFTIGNGKLDRWAITHPGNIAVVIEVDRAGPLGLI